MRELRQDLLPAAPRLQQVPGQEFEKTILAQDGDVETFTIIRVAPSGFGDEAPYAVGDRQAAWTSVKVTAQIVDCDLDKLAIGDPVRLEFRRLQQDGESGILCYGYKFVPVAS